MKAIGHGRLTRVLDGSGRTTMEINSLRVTGRAIAGEWNMIIAGTGIATATTIEIATTTITIKNAHPVRFAWAHFPQFQGLGIDNQAPQCV